MAHDTEQLFEFDPDKSASNLEKHGISFLEAQRLWESPVHEFPSPIDSGEDRWLVAGVIDDKNWTAVVTYRDKATRIISVRRSRKKEVEDYERYTYKNNG